MLWPRKEQTQRPSARNMEPSRNYTHVHEWMCQSRGQIMDKGYFGLQLKFELYLLNYEEPLNGLK